CYVQERLDAILAMPNLYKRLRAIMAVADNLGSDEIHDALVRLEKVHFQERDKLLFVLLHRWGELDPKAALDYARKIKADDRSSAVTHVIKGWCESDPAAAQAWIAALPRGPVKDAAQGGFIEALAGTDPIRAFALARNGPAYALASLFSTWAGTNAREAASYALQ